MRKKSAVKQKWTFEKKTHIRSSKCLEQQYNERVDRLNEMVNILLKNGKDALDTPNENPRDFTYELKVEEHAGFRDWIFDQLELTIVSLLMIAVSCWKIAIFIFKFNKRND